MNRIVVKTDWSEMPNVTSAKRKPSPRTSRYTTIMLKNHMIGSLRESTASFFVTAMASADLAKYLCAFARYDTRNFGMLSGATKRDCRLSSAHVNDFAQS